MHTGHLLSYCFLESSDKVCKRNADRRLHPGATHISS
jgi:hypothetical protein